MIISDASRPKMTVPPSPFLSLCVSYLCLNDVLLERKQYGESLLFLCLWTVNKLYRSDEKGRKLRVAKGIYSW